MASVFELAPLSVVAAALLAAAAFACGASSSPPTAPSAPATGTPAAPESAGDACRKTVNALGMSIDGGATDFETHARMIDEERRAVVAAGLQDDGSGMLATYVQRAGEAAATLRKLTPMPGEVVERDSTEFVEAMSEFMTLCMAPDCGAVSFLIGAHTMHQPRLDQTLPLLADELDKVHLKDPKMQASLVKLSAKARKSGASMAKLMSASDDLASTGPEAKKRLDALEASRAMLRSRCKRP